MSHYTQWNLSDEARIVTASLFKVQTKNSKKKKKNHSLVVPFFEKTVI
jgi:outer membrane receptor for monomeric catechols